MDLPVNEDVSFLDRASSVNKLDGLREVLLQILLRRICSSDAQVLEVGLYSQIDIDGQLRSSRKNTKRA